jgi:K+-transporting ATPase ATPase C chain
VAHARHLPREQIDALIQAHTDAPLLGVLGEPAVNVLTLNLALDQLRPAR